MDNLDSKLALPIIVLLFTVIIRKGKQRLLTLTITTASFEAKYKYTYLGITATNFIIGPCQIPTHNNTVRK